MSAIKKSPLEYGMIVAFPVIVFISSIIMERVFGYPIDEVLRKCDIHLGFVFEVLIRFEDLSVLIAYLVVSSIFFERCDTISAFSNCNPQKIRMIFSFISFLLIFYFLLKVYTLFWPWSQVSYWIRRI